MQPLKVYSYSTQGERDYMEDYLYLDNIDKNRIFAGIYDGHGDYKAAEFASQKLHQYFYEALLTQSPLDAFGVAYRATNNELTPDMGGTCALTVYIDQSKVFYANAGDGRILVVRKDSIKELSTQHNIHNEAERERILENGGSIKGSYVLTEYRGLKVTRSLGDIYHKKIGVITAPSVGVYQITPEDLFLLICSDGLDILNNGDLSQEVMLMSDIETLSKTLVDKSIQKGSQDNITLVIMKLYIDQFSS